MRILELAVVSGLAVTWGVGCEDAPPRSAPPPVAEDAGQADQGTPDEGPAGTADAGADMAGDQGADPPSACIEPPPAKVSFESLPGFTDSEDFAFDDQGRVVMSEGGNLVRMTKAGEKRVFVPNFGPTAGMRFLPGGDLVVSDLATGSIKRVAPNGGQTVVLSGLEYANGLEVAQQGFIYVAEQNAGRVRRIDPATGDFVVVGYGMTNPNGVSLSVDEKTLFVGSFGAGVIYAIDLTDDDGRGATRLHGRISTVPPESGALVDPCAGSEVGRACSTPVGLPGSCELLGGVLDCVRPPACEGLVEGYPCMDALFMGGECRTNAGGLLECVADMPCRDLSVGDACAPSGGGPGVCFDYGGGMVDCVSAICAESLPEGACQLPNGADGVCTDGGFGILMCEWADPCGVTKEPGDPCVFPDATPGACQGDAEFTYCGVTRDTCEAGDLAAGEPCTDAYGLTGTCVDSEGRSLCAPQVGCEGLPADAPCLTEAQQVGRCAQSSEGIVCYAPDDCAERASGDACTSGLGFPGRCGGEEGLLSCQAPPCTALPVGALCESPLGSGFCMPDALTGARCEAFNGCSGLSAGDFCGTNDGQTGLCEADAQGRLQCTIAEDCQGREDGVPCNLPGSYGGACQAGACVDPNVVLEQACAEAAEGEACRAMVFGLPMVGSCVLYDPSAPLFCMPTSDPVEACVGLAAGAACFDGVSPGRCAETEDGLACGGGGGVAGGLDGITVDGCGSVYVTEFTLGQIWRFSPEGGEGSVVVKLPSAWIPNMHFGSGLGDWRKDRLYVADREGARLFELDTQTPPSPDAWPPSLQAP